MDRFPVARPIEDVVADCRKIFISKLPGNKMVGAAWGAFCEAHELYDFAQRVIDNKKAHSDLYLWQHFGQHYAAAKVIRAVADGLGVPNVTWREVVHAESAVV